MLNATGFVVASHQYLNFDDYPGWSLAGRLIQQGLPQVFSSLRDVICVKAVKPVPKASA